MDVLDDSVNCCAVDEIANLADHEGNAEEALHEFCACSMRYIYKDGVRSEKKMLDVAAFVLFTGLTQDDGRDERTGYGSTFAAYLKRHHLGTVVESPARYNRRNHPDHKVKVWIWAPSLPGLTAWMKTHKEE